MKRKQKNIPNTLYHITQKKFLDSILKEGLIPLKEKTARYEEEEIGDDARIGIFLSSDYEVILDMDPSFSEYKELSVLEVDVKEIKDKLVSDIAYDFGSEDFFSEQDIEEGLYDQFSWFYNGIIEKEKIKHIKDIYK